MMTNTNTAADLGAAARVRALSAIYVHVFGDTPACQDNLQDDLRAVLDFDADMWMSETLDDVEVIAAADADPDAWSDTKLPRLTQSELDRQTDAVVAKALKDRYAPAAASGARGMRR